jgi:hypothetical protein
MKLFRGSLEQYNEKRKDVKDKRKYVAWAVFSYFDEKGIEYRKSFTAKVLTSELEFFSIAPEIIVK